MDESTEWAMNFFGWILFTFSALLFTWSSLESGDPKAISASLLFLVACPIFMIPLLANSPLWPVKLHPDASSPMKQVTDTKFSHSSTVEMGEDTSASLFDA